MNKLVSANSYNVCFFIDINNISNSKPFNGLTVKSLINYCENNDINLYRWDNDDYESNYELLPHTVANNCLQRFPIINWVNESSYKNLLMVDVDILFNKNAPNIFYNINKNKMYSRRVQSKKSEQYEKNHKLKLYNNGVILMGENFINNYTENLSFEKMNNIVYKLTEHEKKGKAVDQLIFHLLRKEKKLKCEELDWKFNFGIGFPRNKIDNNLNYYAKNTYFIHYAGNRKKSFNDHINNETIQENFL